MDEPGTSASTQMSLLRMDEPGTSAGTQSDIAKMTRGRELPVNSKVRRRLFSEDDPEPPPERISKDSRTEYIARTLNNELILKGMRWNFDFYAELAIPGFNQWYRKESSNEWVVMKPVRNVPLRKRSTDPSKSTYEDERRKVRRLSPRTVALRQRFFANGRVQNAAVCQALQENVYNEFKESGQLSDSSDSGSNSSSTEDEDELTDSSDEDQEDRKKNKAKTNAEEKEYEASNNIEDKDEVETDVVVNTNYQGTSADVVEMEKDAHDNQEPSISEYKFEKLLTEDSDNADITEEDEEKPNDMKNMNEATPKNEKKAMAEQNNGKPLQARNGKAKKKLDNSCY